MDQCVMAAAESVAVELDGNSFLDSSRSIPWRVLATAVTSEATCCWLSPLDETWTETTARSARRLIVLVPSTLMMSGGMVNWM